MAEAMAIPVRRPRLQRPLLVCAVVACCVALPLGLLLPASSPTAVFPPFFIMGGGGGQTSAIGGPRVKTTATTTDHPLTTDTPQVPAGSHEDGRPTEMREEAISSRTNTVGGVIDQGNKRDGEVPVTTDVSVAESWVAGGVLGPLQRAAEDALNVALLEELRALGTPTLRGLTHNPALHSSGRVEEERETEKNEGEKKGQEAADADGGGIKAALSRLFTGLVVRIATTPFAATDCSVVPTPATVAQCLCAAVLGMERHESDRLERILFPHPTRTTSAVAASANHHDTNRNTPSGGGGDSSGRDAAPSDAFSIFRDVAAFRPTQCAHVVTCLQWASGRLSGPSGKGMQWRSGDSEGGGEASSEASKGAKGGAGAARTTSGDSPARPSASAVTKGGLGGAAADTAAAQTVASTTRVFRSHFGAVSGDVPSLLRLLTLRRAAITAAGPKDTTPLILWHPTAACPPTNTSLRRDRSSSSSSSSSGDLSPGPEASSPISSSSSSSSSSCRSLANNNNNSSSMSRRRSITAAVHYDLHSEQLAVHIEQSLCGNGSTTQAVTSKGREGDGVGRGEGGGGGPLPFIGPVRTLHILRLASRRRSVVLQPSGGLLPGLVALSGDSVLRGVYYSLVATLRGNIAAGTATAGADSAHSTDDQNGHTPLDHQQQHAWNTGAAFQSKILYVRFRGCCDVLLTNIRNAADGKDDEKAPQVSDTVLQAALNAFLKRIAPHVTKHADSSANTNNAPTPPQPLGSDSSKKHAALFDLIALLRVGGGDGVSYVPLRWTLGALRAACAASGHLCPDLLLAFEFDNKAEAKSLSFMSPAAAELFLRLSAGTSTSTAAELLQLVPPSERPVEDIVPVAVHLHSVGVWMHEPAAVLNRLAARTLATAIPSTTTAIRASSSTTSSTSSSSLFSPPNLPPPILIQRLAPMYKHQRGRDDVLQARFRRHSHTSSSSSTPPTPNQQEGEHRGQEDSAQKREKEGGSPPRWWPSLVKRLPIRGEVIDVLVSAMTPADSRLLLPDVVNQPLPIEAAVNQRLAPIIQPLLSGKGKHLGPYETMERTVRRKGQLPFYVRGYMERMDVEAWGQLRLLLALAGTPGHVDGNTTITRPKTAAITTAAADSICYAASPEISRAAAVVPGDPTSEDRWSRDPDGSSHTGTEASKHEQSMLKHFQRLLLPARSASSLLSSRGLIGDVIATMGSSSPPASTIDRVPADTSSLFVYDAALIQTLHGFGGNDILHTDCHCAAPIADAKFGDRVPPSLVPQLEHALAALFTSMRRSDQIDISMMIGDEQRDGSSCDLPLVHTHGPIRCVKAPAERERGSSSSSTSFRRWAATTTTASVTATSLAASTVHPASSSTALSLFFQTEHRKAWLSSVPGCQGWVAGEAMRLRGPSAGKGLGANTEGTEGGGSSLAVRCGVLMSQSLTGCRNPLAEAELALVIGHIAEMVAQ